MTQRITREMAVADADLPRLRQMKTLDQLKPGECGTVKSVTGAGTAIYQRLLEMGVFEGAELKVVRFAPLGDPMEITVQGYNLSLRKAEAKMVEVES